MTAYHDCPEHGLSELAIEETEIFQTSSGLNQLIRLVCCYGPDDDSTTHAAAGGAIIHDVGMLDSLTVNEALNLIIDERKAEFKASLAQMIANLSAPPPPRVCNKHHGRNPTTTRPHDQKPGT